MRKWVEKFMYKEKAQFAKNLKYLRTSLGISQTQLGNAVCTTKTVISNLERDKYPPSTEDLLLLSRYFRIPIDILKTADLSDYNPKAQNIKMKKLQEMVDLFFPIVCTEEAMKDSCFREGYNNLLTLRNNRLNGRKVEDNLFEKTLNVLCESETMAAYANLVICMLVLCMQTNQTRTRELYKDIFVKRKNIDKVLNNFCFYSPSMTQIREEEDRVREEKKKLFRECEEVFNQGIGKLKTRTDFVELGDYLWVLTYLLDLVDNMFDQQTNFMVGLEMLANLEAQGNSYAKRFFGMFE